MEKLKKKFEGVTFTLIVAIFISCTSMFQYGFSQNMLNSAEIFLPVYIGSNHTDSFAINEHNKTCSHLNSWFKDCIPLDASLKDTFFDQWSFLVTILLVGGLIGSLICVPMSKFFGRKYSIFVIAFFYLSGYAFQALMPTSFWTFLIGRFLVGIASGINSGVTSFYLNEIAPKQIRGTIGYFFMFSKYLGILICQSLCLFVTTGQTWRIIFGIAAFLGLIQIILINFVPFSPRWLISVKCCRGFDCINYAKKNLQRLRHSKTVDGEFDLILDPNKGNMNEGKKLKMPKKILYKNLVIIGILSFIQQFGGIKAISMYSTKVFENAGITFISAAVITVIISAIRGIAVFLSSFFIDKSGRKPLLLIGIGTQCAMLVTTTVSLSAMEYGSSLGSVWTTIWGIFATISILTYAFAFAIAMGPIPAFVFGELFSTDAKSIGGAVSTLSTYLYSVIITYVYPVMNNSMSQYSFLPFAVVLFVGFFIILFFFKETKGKSIEEICYGIAPIEVELEDKRKKENRTKVELEGDEEENQENDEQENVSEKEEKEEKETPKPSVEPSEENEEKEVEPKPTPPSSIESNEENSIATPLIEEQKEGNDKVETELVPVEPVKSIEIEQVHPSLPTEIDSNEENSEIDALLTESVVSRYNNENNNE